MNDSIKRRLHDQSSGPTTLISEGCKVTGEMSGRGNFQVSGEVIGECDIEGAVSITKSGYWQGKIRAGNVIVAGTVDGDITAAGRVEIADTAKIGGTVTGQAIAVAEGAVVEGLMKTTGRDEPVEFTEKRHPDDEDVSQE